MRRRYINGQNSNSQSLTPLYIEPKNGNVRFKCSTNVEYRTCNTDWVSLPSNTYSPTFSVGQVVSIQGNNSSGGCTFTFSGSCSVGGDPRSLLYKQQLYDGCFKELFKGCSTILDVSKINLPAKILYNNCYYSMFEGCTSITKAPELPATSLAFRCYMRMFYGCTRLKYVEIKALDISPIDCLHSWMYGVPSGGKIVMNKDANWKSVVGASGRPSGWTVTYE